ncbi:MAG TPA: hypothetical protein VGE57_14030 [Solimonas sp.]
MNAFRALLRVVLWITGFWLLLMALSWALWKPVDVDAPLQLSLPDYLAPSPAPLFVGQIQEAVFTLARHCPLPEKRRLIVLGASGSRAYDAETLRRASSADEAVNLSVVLSNVTQITQIFHDYRDCLGAEGLRDSAIVLILSMGNFTSNEYRGSGPYSDYETEKQRSRLFAGAPGAMQPRLPRPWMPAVVELWRPVLLARKLAVEVKASLVALGHRLRGRSPPRVEDLDREWSLKLVASMQPEVQRGDTYAPEQTAELEALLDEIDSAGSPVVLVAQPVQRWFREASPSFAAAQARLQQLARQRHLPLIDLTQSAADEEFHDAMHANRRGAMRWSERLAQALLDLQAELPDALGRVSMAQR